MHDNFGGEAGALREGSLTHCRLAPLWRLSVFAIAACGSLCHPVAAEAHMIRHGAIGFRDGFLHPLTGADHFMAMFAVGLWGAQMGGRSVWTLPVTFPLIMVIGGIAGIAGLPLPDAAIEVGIALSILVLGLSIAASWHPPESVSLAVVAFFALCHGYAHGVELPNAADPADFAIGFVIATGMIHLMGIGVGFGINRYYRGLLTRGLGGFISLGGVYFLT